MTPPIRYSPPTPSPLDAELLGEPVTLPFSKRVLKSRIFKAAIGERMFSWDQTEPSKRGIPFDRAGHLYKIWGQGGYSIIISGQVMVDPMHIEIPGSAVIHKSTETSKSLAQFEKMASAGKANGSLTVMQILHPGGRVPTYINKHPVSAGNLKNGEPCEDIVPLTIEGIQQIESQFVYAADIAYRTKFDGVQINAAFSYLLAQFLSMETNNRTDDYGGNIFNRSRFTREVIQKIRERIKDSNFVIGVKISLGEFREQMKDAVEFCQELEKLSVDFIELSGEPYKDPEDPNSAPSSLEEFAKAISSSLAKTLVFITGGFRSSEVMATAIRKGHCTSVGIGVPCSSDPHLPKQIISGHIGGATRPDPETSDKPVLYEAVGTQIEALARGDNVFDWSNPGLMRQYKEKLEVFQSKRAQALKDGVIEAGYMVWSPESTV